jgi:hypothetical protein
MPSYSQWFVFRCAELDLNPLHLFRRRHRQ